MFSKTIKFPEREFKENPGLRRKFNVTFPKPEPPHEIDYSVTKKFFIFLYSYTFSEFDLKVFDVAIIIQQNSPFNLPLTATYFTSYTLIIFFVLTFLYDFNVRTACEFAKINSLKIIISILTYTYKDLVFSISAYRRYND